MSRPLDHPDAALRPPLIQTTPGPAYASTRRAWQGIPTIERAPDGRLWAAWYSGGKTEGPDNHVLLVTSGDDGATWSEPVLVIDPPGDVLAFDPVLWIDPAGRLWLFWAQGFKHFDGRCGVWAITTDQPDAPRPTWTAPQRLAHGIMMNKPTVLADGAWLMPAAIWSHVPADPPLTLEAERFSNVYRSRDRGATWDLLGRADVPERDCDEPMIVQHRDGSLRMFVRTRYGIGQSRSRDGGVTWSPGSPSGITGPVTRFFIRRLRSGNLLLLYHDHPTARTNLAAWLSEDDGQTWRGRLILDDRPGVSYPDAAESPDGLIRVIYDRQRTTEREIIMARFTESDVAQGRCVAPRSALRMLVDRAGG